MKTYKTPTIEIEAISLGSIICNSPGSDIQVDAPGIQGGGTGGLSPAPQRKVF